MTLVGLGARRCLLDNSVYARAQHPALACLLAQASASERLVTCGAFVTEAIYSARDGAEAADFHRRLTIAIPYVETDEAVWRLSHRTQLELAQVTERFHRRPPIDYLIAATAHRHGLDVLHYDRDYDLIAEHSSLEFESRWVAEPGTL